MDCRLILYYSIDKYNISLKEKIKGPKGIDGIQRLYCHAADSTVLQSALLKMSGLSNGDYAMATKVAMVEAQGVSAINDLLTEIGNNPEFAGYATKTTVNAEAELCLV